MDELLLERRELRLQGIDLSLQHDGVGRCNSMLRVAAEESTRGFPCRVLSLVRPGLVPFRFVAA
ncbi:hypothetical protein [Pontiella sulfatireligans]|uniref:Uncharacterized protein n=1 Tax=Pontiella sulfatireligans TaxID=2750658 RepID=A0A6C2UU27_9BACT|nr:hypothetical protein [Pontiella sulfatireligans]VGO22386.1 hypothetical protein SCARR_04469 [Pontiella sulfatireligans]